MGATFNLTTERQSIDQDNVRALADQPYALKQAALTRLPKADQPDDMAKHCMSQAILYNRLLHIIPPLEDRSRFWQHGPAIHRLDDRSDH